MSSDLAALYEEARGAIARVEDALLVLEERGSGSETPDAEGAKEAAARGLSEVRQGIADLEASGAVSAGVMWKQCVSQGISVRGSTEKWITRLYALELLAVEWSNCGSRRSRCDRRLQGT